MDPGMTSTKLPTEMRGEWIWDAGSVDAVESYVFLRREFALNETPSVGELWITANTMYHLYVNGRYFCRGPAPSPADKHYVSYFDIGFLLEIGRNVIAVIAHNTSVSRHSRCRAESGFWCQLNVDGSPFIWTDVSWQVRPGSCFLPNQPRSSASSSFVETLDYRQYPHGWTEVGYEKEDWRDVDFRRSIEAEIETFVAAPDFDPFTENVLFDKVVVQGMLASTKATVNLTFTRVFKDARGVYAGETYVRAKEDRDDIEFKLFCDDPYCFIVNEEVIKMQGVGEAVNWADSAWDTPRCYLQSQITEVGGALTLREGWNHIIFVQQVEPGSNGATFVFSDLNADTIKFVRSMDSFSLPGWNVYGPLPGALATMRAPLHFGGFKSVPYFNFDPCDIAGHFQTYTADVISTDETPSCDITLEQDQYVVLEAHRYVRGAPEMTFSGAAGDIIDVFFGDYITDNVVNPHDEGYRRVYTVVLDDITIQWSGFATHGMKYVMLHVRKAVGEVLIESIGIRKLTFSFKNPGGFNCSDELLNKIWLNGAYTLEVTYDYAFMNSSAQLESQLLSDAMIQSVSAFFLMGNYGLSEKALREFSWSQFPTGEIPAATLSDFFVRWHDHALLWPVWLQKHIIYSGNTDIAHELSPSLEKLLSFFESMADKERFVLGNGEADDSNDYLIDYDSNLDRRGISTSLNALYCHCLLQSEWIFSLIDQKDKAKICHERAAIVAEAIRELTWDEERSLFADSWYDGKPSESFSLQTNILAIYAGLAKPEQHDLIFKNSLLEDAPYLKLNVEVGNDTPYFKFFLLDTAFICEKREWALDFMRYYWGKMVQEGAQTWWERFSPEPEFDLRDAGAQCFGYGISPNYFLIREVVGIRPVQPGALQVYFNPMLTAAEWVQAQIPTVHGQIRVGWSFEDTDHLEIVIDADYPLEIIPKLSPQFATNATFHVSDVVSVLEPAAVG